MSVAWRLTLFAQIRRVYTSLQIHGRSRQLFKQYPLLGKNTVKSLKI